VPVKRIQNTYYVVADMERTVAFYKELLGLSLKFQDGPRWAQFEVGGAALAFSNAAEGAVPPGSGAVVTLEVDDLDAMARAFADRGTEIVRPIRDMGQHGRTMAIRDPEGNVVQLYQRAAKLP
jgi:predicted enzyme related to lactoylglutathione lyase